MDVRLIDANALCKNINEGIKLALEWENEAREKKNTHGIKCAIATRRSLLSMLERVIGEPTIEAQPVKHGKWSECWSDQVRNVISVICSECGNASITCLPIIILDGDDLLKKICIQMPYCPKCGANMEV